MESRVEVKGDRWGTREGRAGEAEGVRKNGGGNGMERTGKRTGEGEEKARAGTLQGCPYRAWHSNICSHCAYQDGVSCLLLTKD